MLGTRITAPRVLILISEKANASVFTAPERSLNAAYRRTLAALGVPVKMTFVVNDTRALARKRLKFSLVSMFRL
ncbi:MAG TPA: hypothetical protein VL424_14940 [Pararobbsia sp.]|jgi:hypothetical protein|nr:hypothetical protein [Pararobbsia sp.]